MPPIRYDYIIFFNINIVQASWHRRPRPGTLDVCPENQRLVTFNILKFSWQRYTFFPSVIFCPIPSIDKNHTLDVWMRWTLSHRMRVIKISASLHKLIPPRPVFSPIFFIRLGEESEDIVSCPSFLRPVLPEVNFFDDLKFDGRLAAQSRI